MFHTFPKRTVTEHTVLKVYGPINTQTQHQIRNCKNSQVSGGFLEIITDNFLQGIVSLSVDVEYMVSAPPLQTFIQILSRRIKEFTKYQHPSGCALIILPRCWFYAISLPLMKLVTASQRPEYVSSNFHMHTEGQGHFHWLYHIHSHRKSPKCIPSILSYPNQEHNSG